MANKRDCKTSHQKKFTKTCLQRFTNNLPSVATASLLPTPMPNPRGYWLVNPVWMNMTVSSIITKLSMSSPFLATKGQTASVFALNYLPTLAPVEISKLCTPSLSGRILLCINSEYKALSLLLCCVGMKSRNGKTSDTDHSQWTFTSCLLLDIFTAAAQRQHCFWTVGVWHPPPQTHTHTDKKNHKKNSPDRYHVCCSSFQGFSWWKKSHDLSGKVIQGRLWF